jgi:7-carboxy-7-deazaguanine synthase
MVNEAFGPTIQGEGALIGKPTVFVRTGGCDYRCSWCDSLYAVLPEYKSEWQAMTTEEVFAEVQRLSGGKPILVTLSGGNPAIQPLEPLIDLGHQHGYTFAIETQGSVAQPWFAKLDYLTLSPKPPSSKMKTNWQRLDKCLDIVRFERHCATILKVVVFDDADYAYAQEVHFRYPHIPMYLQVGNETVGNFDVTKVLQKLEWLINKVIADRWNSVVVLPQLHTLIWQNQRGK